MSDPEALFQLRARIPNELRVMKLTVTPRRNSTSTYQRQVPDDATCFACRNGVIDVLTHFLLHKTDR